MKPISLPILIAVLVAAAVAGGVTSAVVARCAPESRPAPAAASPATPEIAASLREIAAQQEQISAAVEALGQRIERVEQQSARVPEPAAPIEVASAPAPVAGGVSKKDAKAAKASELTLESALAQLLDENTTYQSREELWQKAREAGLLDDLVAEYERRAEREPNNPDLKVELSEAYVQKIFEAGGGPLAGVWATKSDKALDQALELDPQHWDARFSKAVGLSFWPPVFGKQAESISQFETLITQQEAGHAKPEFAKTYLLLGNLYNQSGKSELAIATWQKGAGLFPNDDELKTQLKTYQKP